MKKGLLVTFIVLIIAVFILPTAFASDVSQTKRHVAMVYDDSTSMYVSDTSKKPVLNWAYANYMTQAFLALLNPQDSLYITYMSDTEKEDVTTSNLLIEDKIQAIDKIRGKQDFINKTPIEAVESAYSMLKELDEEITDEYWLVVVTDGGFTDYEGDITEKLLGYIDEMATIDKTLKVVFLAIGNNAKPPSEDEAKGLLVYETGLDDIVTTMSSLADNISGRHNVSTSRMSELSGNRLSVDLLLPVRSLIVFSQTDENKLVNISNSKDEAMISSVPISIKAPKAFEYSDKITTITDENVVGVITRVDPENEGEILSEGRYILSFKEPANVDNIRVMYEPAIDIKIRYKQEGKYVENPEDGSLCDIEVVLINSLTGNNLNSKVLPEEIACNIQIVSEGITTQSIDGYLIKDIMLKSEDTSIITEISMPGYFALRNRHDYYYQIQQVAAATTPPEYDDTKGPWPPEVELLVQMPQGSEIDIRKLEEASPFLIIPLFNDEIGQLNDLQMGSLNIFCSRTIEFEVTISEDYKGFLIAPKYSGDMYLTSTGTIDVDIAFQSEYEKVAEKRITFTVSELSWLERNSRIILIPFLALIIIIIILGIMVLRRKFAKGSWLELAQMHKNMSGEWIPSKAPASIYLNNLKGRWRMVPFAPERVKVSNVTFYPSTDDYSIIVSKQSLKPNMGTTKGMLEGNELKNDYYLMNAYRLFIEDGENRLVFVYHGPKRTLLTNKNNKRK